MTNRELVVLGTASQAPTRSRNHNGYFLRWDDEGLLFDPGEGTQRQMLFAGVTTSQITRICVTHFHGDHCLGLPGVLQRMSLDQVAHVVEACYPADSHEVFGRLRHASLFHDRLLLRERRVAGSGLVTRTAAFRLEAMSLSHVVPTVGYRLVEPDGRRMLPDRLAALGIAGPDISRLQHEGRLAADGRTVTLEEVSEPRRGQRFAFVMDTRICDAAFALADGADMLVCESTFANAEASLAREWGHLTAGQAGQIAAKSGARLLVLTHFSQRYESGDGERLACEAAAEFGGEVVMARDLDRIPVPARRVAAAAGGELRILDMMSAFLYLDPVSYEEKGTWVYLVASAGAYAVYVAIILGRVLHAPVAQVPYVSVLLWTAGASIVANMVGRVVVETASPSDSRRPDVRDREIYRFGEYASRWFLVAGAAAALLMAMARWDYFWIANAIYLGFVLWSVAGSVLKLLAYRRGLQAPA